MRRSKNSLSANALYSFFFFFFLAFSHHDLKTHHLFLGCSLKPFLFLFLYFPLPSKSNFLVQPEVMSLEVSVHRKHLRSPFALWIPSVKSCRLSLRRAGILQAALRQLLASDFIRLTRLTFSREVSIGRSRRPCG